MAQPLKKTFIDTLIYGLSIILTKGVSIILTPMYADTLEKAGDYGVLTFFLVAIAGISVILPLGLETAYFNFVTKDHIKNIEGKMFFTHLVIAILSGLGFWLYSEEMAHLITNSSGYEHYFLVTIGILCFDLLCVIPFAQLRKEQRSIHFGLINIIYVSVTLLLNILFLVYFPIWKHDVQWLAFFDESQLVYYVLVATLVGSIVKFLLLFPQVIRYKLEWNKVDFTVFFKYSLPIMIGGMAYVINEMIDREFIKHLIEDAKTANGIYSMNYKVAGLLMIMITGYRLGVEPFVFKLAGGGKAKTTYAFLLKALTVLMTFAALGILFNKDLIQTYFTRGVEYHSGFVVVPPLLLAMIFSGMYYNLSVWYKIESKTRYGMYFSIVGACVTIALNWMFVPKYGYIACAWATFLCYFVMSVLSYSFGQKHYKIPYDLTRVITYLGLGVGLYYVGLHLDGIHSLLDNSLLLVFIGIAYLLEKNEINKLKPKKS